MDTSAKVIKTDVKVDSNQYLFKGKKGVYFKSREGKIFFPDRSFTDACEGCVTDVKITLDKGTYAFFTGKMVAQEDCSFVDLVCQLPDRAYAWVDKRTVNGVQMLIVLLGDTLTSGLDVYLSTGLFCKIENGDSIVAFWNSKDNNGLFHKTADMVNFYQSMNKRVSTFSRDKQFIGIIRHAILGNLRDDFITLKTLRCFVINGCKVAFFTNSYSFLYGGLYSDSLNSLKGSVEDWVNQLELPIEEVCLQDVWSFAKDNNIAYFPSILTGSIDRDAAVISCSLYLGSVLGNNDMQVVKLFNPLVLTEDDLHNEGYKSTIVNSIEGYKNHLRKLTSRMSPQSISKIGSLRRIEEIVIGYRL